MYLNMAMLAAKATAGTAIWTASTGKKIIEVALPAAKKASSISITFLKGGIDAVKEKKSENIQLSDNLGIVNNHLSIPLSFVENQIKIFQKSVFADLNMIKGQNEIQFLSNSISYFLESHIGKTGLDRSISYALQYDITAVRKYLDDKSYELRFPGYLLHQCSSLAETIKDLNIFYSAILSHGKVPSFSEKFVREELSRRYGAEQRKGDIRSYIPYQLQLPILREHAVKRRKYPGPIKRILGGDESINFSEICDIANEALYFLSEELIANEELEHKISQMVDITSGKRLVVESYYESNEETQ